MSFLGLGGAPAPADPDAVPSARVVVVGNPGACDCARGWMPCHPAPPPAPLPPPPHRTRCTWRWCRHPTSGSDAFKPPSAPRFHSTGCGKTSLVHALVHGRPPARPAPTVGCSVQVKVQRRKERESERESWKGKKNRY